MREVIVDGRILVLGPPAVARAGATTLVHGRLTRTLLAALVVGVNHALPIDRLEFLLWGERPPADARNALQGHVARLRSLLGPGTIEVADASYVLVADCDDIDACAFERLVHEAVRRLPDEPKAALDLCRRALVMWRGVAYGDLADMEPFHVEALRLDELRQSAIEVELEAEVRIGERVRAVSQLRAALAENPYREHLWRLLVEVLARDGRRGEALSAYDEYTATMAELGLEADGHMRELRRRIAAGTFTNSPAGS